VYRNGCKIDEVAFSEILVADTDLESGAELAMKKEEEDSMPRDF
jgi:hypothetical protein